MGRIFYILGKSASGKDSIYERLKADPSLPLKPVVLFTTRPRRSGEVDGVTYHYVDEQTLDTYRREGKVIESRTYQTIHGPWTYATVDNGHWDLENQSYLMVGVLDSYRSIRSYFGDAWVIPLYIEVEDGERLTRALNREKSQKQPKYEEMCRRFLADQKDFAEDKLQAEGIEIRYQNRDLEECITELKRVICENLQR